MQYTWCFGTNRHVNDVMINYSLPIAYIVIFIYRPSKWLFVINQLFYNDNLLIYHSITNDDVRINLINFITLLPLKVYWFIITIIYRLLQIYYSCDYWWWIIDLLYTYRRFINKLLMIIYYLYYSITNASLLIWFVDLMIYNSIINNDLLLLTIWLLNPSITNYETMFISDVINIMKN